MIFPAGKARNNGFNVLTDDVKSFETREKERQTTAMSNASLSITEKLAKLRESDGDLSAVRSPHSIGKANCGALSDIGGPIRQMKTHMSNSIWNPDRLAQIKDGEITRGEQIKADNEKVAAEKQQLRREVFTIDPEAIKAVMRSSHSAVNTSAHATESSNYHTRVAAHQLSIFDKPEKLDEMLDLTAGERIQKSAAERRNKRKDKSWQAVQPTVTTKQKLSTFFTSLQQSKKGR